MNLSMSREAKLELMRQMIELNRLHRLREKYKEAKSEQVKQLLKHHIDYIESKHKIKSE